MKKFMTCSSQYKIISEQTIQNQNHPNPPNPQSFARSFTPKSTSIQKIGKNF